MADPNINYRFYISEQLRKYLKLNLRKNAIFLFKINNIMYLSTDTIPINLKDLQILKVKIGQEKMFIDIPNTAIAYEPKAYSIVHAKGKIIKLEK